MRMDASPGPCWVSIAAHPWVAEAAGRSSATLALVHLLRACSVPLQPSASSPVLPGQPLPLPSAFPCLRQELLLGDVMTCSASSSC